MKMRWFTCIRGSVRALAIAAMLLAGASTSSATSVLDFDSIGTPNCGGVAIDPITTGYGGFTWDANLAVECNADYMGASGWGNGYGAPSAQNAIFNQAGTTSVAITRAATFQFDGAMVSGWTFADAVDLVDDLTAQSITVTGFLGATQVGTETLTLAGADGSAALQYLVLNGITGAIDRLQITTPVTNGRLGNFWLLDDFQFEDVNNGGGGGPDNPAVPEPASLVLVGSGIVAALKRRGRFFQGRVR